MWKKTYSTTTNQITKEQIWKLTTDIDNWKTWDSSVEDSRLTGEFKAGNYFMLKPAGGPKVNIKLLEIIPYQKFIDLTTFPLAKMYGEHVYEEVPEGLKITVSITVTGLLKFLWIRLVARKIADDLANDVANQILHAKKIQAVAVTA